MKRFLLFCLLLTSCDKINDTLLPHEPLPPDQAHNAFVDAERAHLLVQNVVRQTKVTDPLVLEMLQQLKSCEVKITNSKESKIITIAGKECPINFKEITTTNKNGRRYTYSYRVKSESFQKLNRIQGMFLKADISSENSWNSMIDLHFADKTVGGIQFTYLKDAQIREEYFKISQQVSILLKNGLLSGTSFTDVYIVKGKEVPTEPKCEVNKVPTRCKDLKSIFNESLSFELPVKSETY